jgi:hypothetical protein
MSTMMMKEDETAEVRMIKDEGMLVVVADDGWRKGRPQRAGRDLEAYW